MAGVGSKILRFLRALRAPEVAGMHLDRDAESDLPGYSSRFPLLHHDPPGSLTNERIRAVRVLRTLDGGLA